MKKKPSLTPQCHWIRHSNNGPIWVRSVNNDWSIISWHRPFKFSLFNLKIKQVLVFPVYQIPRKSGQIQYIKIICGFPVVLRNFSGFGIILCHTWRKIIFREAKKVVYRPTPAPTFTYVYNVRPYEGIYFHISLYSLWCDGD